MSERTPEEKETTKSPKNTIGKAFSRRTFTFGAAGALLLFGLGAVKFLPRTPLCRPPGGQDEDSVISTCLHCEKCREICPKNAIGPSHIEQGILMAGTPRMSFRQGWCDFCENVEGGPRCIAVCPTHALKEVDVSRVIIGKAFLNRDWCLAAKGMGCHECVDVCNYEALAINYNQVPIIDFNACNGCGACENACISLSAGSITAGATDRAIIVIPHVVANERRVQGEETGVYQ